MEKHDSDHTQMESIHKVKKNFRKTLSLILVFLLLAGQILPAAVQAAAFGVSQDELYGEGELTENSYESEEAYGDSSDSASDEASGDDSDSVFVYGSGDDSDSAFISGSGDDSDSSFASGSTDSSDSVCGSGSEEYEEPDEGAEDDAFAGEEYGEGQAFGEDAFSGSAGNGIEEGEEYDGDYDADCANDFEGEGSDRPEEDGDDTDEADTTDQVITARLEEEAGTSESDDVLITLSGEMPSDAEVTASDAVDEAVEAGLFDVLCAYDITINDGWQPEEALEVSIFREELPENVKVYHIGDDGVPEEVDVTCSETGEVAFRAEGFSIYAVTDGLCRRTYEFMDYKFGSYLPYEFTMTLPEDPDDPLNGVFTANRQILRNGDRLVVPSLPNKDGMRFLGWYTSPDADINLMNPERGGIKNDITVNSIVTLYARYGWPATITYYTRPEGTADNQVFSTQIVYLPEEGGSVTLDLTDQLYPEAPYAGQGFLGWKEAARDEEEGAEPVASPDVCIDSEHYVVTGDVTLYPCYSMLHKIAFAGADDNEEYMAPIWIGEEGTSGSLTDHVPVRKGYTFAGWGVESETGAGQDGNAGTIAITDASAVLLQTTLTFPGGSLTNGILTLTDDITVQSLWIPEEVSYRVVFWKEKSSDTKKLVFADGNWAVPENQKEYDFLGTLRIPAPAGSTVSEADLEAGYGSLAGCTEYALDEGNTDFTGLVYHSIKDVNGDPVGNFVVTSDGAKTVHVYYDRAVVTLLFDYPEDISEETEVSNPDYYPSLPTSGSATQNAVTAISSVDYPDDYTLTGLYGGNITDGKTGTDEAAYWPVAYTARNLSYTLTTRNMQYTSGQWQRKSGSESQKTESERSFSTHWIRENGSTTYFEEYFGESETFTPARTLEHLRVSGTDSAVSYYQENETAAYPASAVYATSPSISYSVPNGETLVVENVFTGYELDYFTYTDSKGTPIRRESSATLEQRTLTGGTFTNLKIYCKKCIHYLIFHNGPTILSDSTGVKYGMSLATDYVKQSVVTPALPAELAGRADELEFAGWFLDEECTIYLDFVGLKASGRAQLMLQYDQIQKIFSVYDYRPSSGVTIPAIRMDDQDLHLFAGWVCKRVLVELEPDGGELPADVPTYFWKNYGDTVSVYPVSRDYVAAEDGAYVYHTHTYALSQLDNNMSDRTAVYREASEGDSGTRYKREDGAFRFLGWFLVGQSANGNEVLTPYDHESHLTGPVKLRAQWSRKGVYRLVYDSGAHGSLSGTHGTKSYRDHASIALNGDVTPDEGYVFTGWKILKPGTTEEYFDNLYSSGDELVINADWADTVMDEYTGEPKGVITLVAQYEPMRGTSITYYVNGGTFVGPTEEEQFADPVLAQELRDRLVKDYGEHAAHHYIYNSSGAVIGYTVSGIEQNANLTTEDGTWFQRSGYKLMGWSSTPGGDVELELHAGSFHAINDPDGTGYVLYAVWKSELQVTYYLQGGTWNSASGPEYRQEGEDWVYGAGKGEVAPVPKDPTREGYAFAGWNTSSGAGKGLQVMPTVNNNVKLYAVWKNTNVVIRFDLNGGKWEKLPDSTFFLLGDGFTGVTLTAGNGYTLKEDIPVKGENSLFYKWEQGAYQYDPGEQIKTTAEQAGQTITLTALWSEGVSAVEVLVGADDSVTVEASESLMGAAEDGSEPKASREIEGYQYLFAVYDEEPETKEDIAEHYRVTSVRRLSEDSYQVKLANGQTKIHYPESVEKLQAVYIEDRPLDVCMKRMNVFADGMDNMNITLTSLMSEAYTQLSVGKVDIQKALPKPKNYIKNGSSNYTSFTYAIGRQNAENMYAIDTMTQGKLWIRQTLNGFAFSVNGEEWKELDREEGHGKDAAVYIIYDNRVETPTTINHYVYGLKADKDKLFTYQILVKGRWGFNIGTAAYFLNKPDDPSEKLNSYTVALHDKENVLIPLHIDYLTGQKQVYSVGDLFYDMFGEDNPTKINNQSELRIWQEVEMRRTNELPFENGTFETSIQMRSVSNSLHNNFNGYDEENHLWLKQLGISRYYTNTFSHSFIYTRTSLDVPIHVLELRRDGYMLRDDWLKEGSEKVSVTADALTIDTAKAEELVNVPEGYAMQSVKYGLSQDNLAGNDSELILRLAGETNDPTLMHLYDYESPDSDTRALVTDGSEIYLIYYRHSSTDVPVEYVKKDASGAYIPVDLDGYGLMEPTMTVTDTASVNFRELSEVKEINSGIEKLEAIYLTGRMFLADQKDNVLTTYEPGDHGDWNTGRAVELINTESGVRYIDDEANAQAATNVKVWIEVASNVPLKIVGRLYQRGSRDTNTGVIPYLPRDTENRIVAGGSFEEEGRYDVVAEAFTAYRNYIPYASDPEATYISSEVGEEAGPVYAVSYFTNEDGYRYWAYKKTETSEAEEMTQILYADYASSYSPVTVHYVLPEGSGYAEVEDLESDVEVVTSIKVPFETEEQEGIFLSDALGTSLENIDSVSSFYRVAGSFVLGSPDLKTGYYTGYTPRIRLSDSSEGLKYQNGTESGVISGQDYPDVYVVLKPIGTLTITKRIDDAGRIARFNDSFTVTLTLGDTTFNESLDVVMTSDESVNYAVPVTSENKIDTLDFTDGVVTFTMQHGQNLVIPGLPRGGRVTVEEQSPSIYNASYKIIQGAKVTAGNSFLFDRHSTVAIVNTTIDITDTGRGYADTFAYALIICGGLAYGLYLLLKRRKI